MIKVFYNALSSGSPLEFMKALRRGVVQACLEPKPNFEIHITMFCFASLFLVPSVSITALTKLSLPGVVLIIRPIG